MENQKIWIKILEIIKQQISTPNYNTWFSKTNLSKIDDQTATIEVPNAFIKNQLISRYQPLLQTSIQQVTRQPLTIEYKINSSLLNKKPLLVADNPNSKQKSKQYPKDEVGEESEEDLEDIFQLTQTTINKSQTLILNTKYTLENFVVGLTNNLAFAAAQAVVQNPGTSYNPLFLFGPSGVGKTHLMQAIGNALIHKNPRTKIIYASSERFMSDYVEAIRTKAMGDFKKKYRSCELLLIDDIQFLSGKDSMQEEFFHTFNELHGKNAQIVMTADRPPNEIQRLESRLASRFQGGLMVDIQLPDFDTRMAILKSKLIERKEALPEEILMLIAESSESNTRELEGKLIQILQLYKMDPQSTDIDKVRKHLGSKPLLNKKLDYKKVLSQVNQYFNTKTPDLLGPRRQKELVLPRQIAMYIMYEDCKISMERVGEILGGRDHTTVLHGVDKIKSAISRDREIQRMIFEIRQQLLS